MIKRVLIISLSIIICIGAGGCMLFKKSYSENEKKDMAIGYLEEKYGEEFIVKSLIPEGWPYSYDIIYFYPKSGTEDDMFVVRGKLLDSGKYSMNDGYFGIIIKDEYEAAMSSFVKELYQDFKLYTDFGSGTVKPDRLNKNTDISEIYNIDEYFSSYTTIFVKQSEIIDVNESLKKIAQKMVDNKLVGKVKIYEVYDDKYEITSIDILNDLDFNKNFVNKHGKYIKVNKNLEISEVE